MSGGEKAIHIIWLYPSVLNLHGDRGNIMALARIGALLELPVQIHRVEAPGDQLPWDSANLLYLGSGQLRDMAHIVRALGEQRDELDKYVADGGQILATGSAGCVLARHTRRADGSVFPGLSLLPMSCTERDSVYGDDIRWLLPDSSEVLGNQIQVVDTALEDEAAPWGRLLYGRGNDGGSGEGCISGKLRFTNTLGPLLVKNPRLTAAILGELARAAGIECLRELTGEDTEYEDKSAELIRAFIAKKMA